MSARNLQRRLEADASPRVRQVGPNSRIAAAAWRIDQAIADLRDIAGPLESLAAPVPGALGEVAALLQPARDRMYEIMETRAHELPAAALELSAPADRIPGFVSLAAEKDGKRFDDLVRSVYDAGLLSRIVHVVEAAEATIEVQLGRHHAASGLHVLLDVIREAAQRCELEFERAIDLENRDAERGA